MRLEQKIKEWDQKSADAIQAIYDEHYQNERFISNLISLIAQSDTETGATWLLKAYLEQSAEPLSKRDTAQLFSILTQLDHWEAKLHILQCLPHLSIDEACKPNVERFLRDCLLSKNKFVRAWSYNGFYLLAQQHNEFEAEATQLLENALEEEAPSVKARIRNLLKSRK